MRKSLSLLALAAMFTANAQITVPRKVQGIDYASTLKDRNISVTYTDAPQKAVAASNFTFDMIESWAGEGANKAGLIIQWNTGNDEVALVFGYRWDGDATGADMLKAVAEANPRLYTLMQYTNVSSPTDPDGGYTINGIGWDADEAGEIRLYDTKNDAYLDSSDGFFKHPRGYVPGQGGSSDYDYDNWIAVDSNDWWQAGWFVNGFWSYWVGDSPSTLGFSSWGASGRVLSDGSWDGWNFEVGFMMDSWKPFEAAPAPIPDDAKTEFYVNGIYYKLSSYTKKTVIVTAPFEYDGISAKAYEGEITIPSSFIDEGTTYTVVGIGDSAFEGSDITEIKLPETLTSIGNSAFANSSLELISGFEKITSIGESAFASTKITNAVLPIGLTEIASSSFTNTPITTLSIPENIISIASDAFNGCKVMTSISIPATVKTIEENAFGNCNNVTIVKVYDTYPLAISDNVFCQETYSNATLIVPTGYTDTYKQADGWKNFINFREENIEANDGDIFIFNGSTVQILSVDKGEYKLTYAKVEGKPTASLIRSANKDFYKGEIVINETITYQGKEYHLTEVNDSAFMGATEMTKLTLPESVTLIPNSTFDGCTSLSEIAMAGNISSIGNYAFNNCSALKAIQLPESLVTIGRNAFANCSSITEISIPSQVTTIPQYAFNKCSSLIRVNGGDGLESMELYAFAYCTSLTDISIPATMTELPQALFQGCSSLVSVEIPANVVKFGNYIFDGCSSLDMEIPAQLTSMGANCYSNCISLKSAKIPAAITEIPNYTFRGCSSLETVTLSDNVTKIGTYAFANCSKLADITIADSSNRSLSVKLPSSISNIMAYAFQNCTSLNLDPVLPSSLTTIGNYAFSGMKQLAEIELPDGLTSIGMRAFENTGLKSIVIPAATTISSNYIFYGCTDLKVYTLSTKAPTIYNYSLLVASGVYPEVYVPTGAKSVYDNNTYWKKVGVKEFPLEVNNFNESVENTTATLSANYTVNYNGSEVPTRFIENNNPELTEVSVSYSVVNEDQEVVTLSESITVSAESADGVLKATLSDLEPKTDYTYNWNYTLGGNDYTSEQGKFSTGSTTSINDICSDNSSVYFENGKLIINGLTGNNVYVYDLNGLLLSSIACSENNTNIKLDLKHGLYIVKAGNNVFKISVR